MDRAAEIHIAVIETLISCAAPRSSNFGDLLSNLPGVYPSDAADALDRLAARHLIDPEVAARLNPRNAGQVPDMDPVEDNDLLPAPHPLDYDWRFSSRTADRLRRRCVELTEPDDLIALLGTPTVLPSAAGKQLQDRRWVLLEASTATTATLSQADPDSVVCCDLARDELPHLYARVVVADPPWYPDHTRAFLWAAAQISTPGSTVLLAQPGIGTRPGVLAERADLQNFAADCGFLNTRVSPGTLEYDCPPFERRSLESSGLSKAVPLTWRHGDLIEMRRVAVQLPLRPALDDDRYWREVVLNGARLRFRTDPPQPNDPGRVDPRLIHLTDGDVLASVSRRHPVRRRVAVWTGCNRIFGCHSPGLLASIAEALGRHEPVTAAADPWFGEHADADAQAHVARAADQLLALARAEHATGLAAGQSTCSIGCREHAAPGQAAGADTPTRGHD